MSDSLTSASNSIILRLQIENEPGLFARAVTAIGDAGGNIGAIDIVRYEKGQVIRDVTVDTTGPEQAAAVAASLDEVEGIDVLHSSDRVFVMHLGGKISVQSKAPLKSRDDLSMAYTPGVARVCMAIHEDIDKARNLTIKRNTVAIVSDGTAVLGLGDIGPEAAMPVMEGKAMLFKEFGDVDGFPLCLDTKDTEEIISVVKAISPGFGGINLEDISAPRCFEIERRLQEELDIPVFHDDQHGTAVVMIAGLINALKVVNKQASDIKAVVAGVGAAGTACTKMMLDLGVTNIIGLDRTGILYRGRDNMNASKEVRRAVRAGHPDGRPPENHEAGRHCLCHEQSHSGDHAGGGLAPHRRHGHRQERLPQSVEQCAVFSRYLPRRPGLPCHPDYRGHEVGRGTGYRRHCTRGEPVGGLYYPRRVQQGCGTQCGAGGRERGGYRSIAPIGPTPIARRCPAAHS
jgi:malate dehydrogenase (oxaloacetate-decarboxylating)